MTVRLTPPIASTLRGRDMIQRRLEKAGLWSLVVRVAREHRVSARLVISRDRSAVVAAARHHVWHLIRSSTSFSLPDIGALFDVDHTTVLSGDRAHTARIARDYQVEAAE